MSTHKESIVCSYLLDAHAYHSGWYLESDCRRRRLTACHVCRRCRRHGGQKKLRPHLLRGPKVFFAGGNHALD